jgi:outer membrane protein assembly factor BamD
MMSTARVLSIVLMLSTTAAALQMAGCSSAPITENEPERLYKEALEDIDGDHYQIAIEKLKTIRNKFPYSSFATEAQLKIADVYFLQESWAEAALAYEAFRDLHPKHEKVAYSMFKAALSYYNDMPGTVARDMTAGQKALESFNEFLRRFPAAPESAEARTHVTECRRLLAEKELYIGNFYYKRDVYQSARPRFQKIVDLYPETQAAAEAKTKLAKLPQQAEPARK